MIDVAGGWHTHFDVLRARLEGGPMPPFWYKAMRIEGEYAERIPEK